MIDTHCHLNFETYAEDQAAVIDRAAAAGVDRIIIPGIDLVSCESALVLTNAYPGIYAAVGVHPNSTSDFNVDMLSQIEHLAAAPTVIAIGEIGLDYYWDKSPKDVQRRAFEQQLVLAARLELPVIIHNRDASEDTLAVLESWVTTLPASLKDRPGVLHSFSAPPQIAERALAAGFYLGFTGPITYKNADLLRSTAAQVPDDRLLVETDGPFLTPLPHRGQRNEPAYIPIIVERLARLKQMTTASMAEITTQNAERLFRLSAAAPSA